MDISKNKNLNQVPLNNQNKRKSGVTGFYIFLLVFVLFFLVHFTPNSIAYAQSQSGYWKLLKVESVGQQKPEISERFRTRDSFKGSTGNGCVEGSYIGYQDLEKSTLRASMAGNIKWAPPPSIADPGKKWDGAYRGEITKDFNMQAKMGYPNRITLEVDTTWKFISKPEKAFRGYHNQKIGFYKSTKKNDTPPSKTSVFVFPENNSGKKYGVIQVNANLSFGGSDTYNYYYQWIPKRPREVTGHLRIIAKNSQGGIVKGLRFIIKNPETGKTRVMITDKKGACKDSFKSKSTAGYVELSLLEIEIDSKTGYGLILSKSSPSYIYPGGKIRIKFNKKIRLTEKNNYMGTLNYTLPIYKLVVIAKKWDEKALKWIQVPANLLIKGMDGKKLFNVGLKGFRKKGEQISADLYLPTKEILKENKISVFGYEPKDKLTDIKNSTIPLGKPLPLPRFLSLQLCTTAQKIARLKYKVYKYFLPILGEEKARLVARLKVELDGSRSKPCYLDGVMYIPGNFDITRDEFSETFMHEWTHHIMNVLSPDPDIEDKLGGGHDIWTKAPTNELAWDEGRAHFFSMLLTRGLELPYNPKSFSPVQAQDSVNRIKNSGECVEGVVTVAVVDFYKSSGFSKTKNIVADFLEVDSLAKNKIGHPPRTSMEFFQMMEQLIDKRKNEGKLDTGKAGRLKSVLNKVKSRYGIR